MNDIYGKAVLVTGGGRGIGAAIALRLARDGADVALTYESDTGRANAVVDEIKNIGRRALADGPNAAAIRGFTALDRFAVPGEIAATVAHLAGPGGAYITGAEFHVDGGFTV
jgi:3-oxoacyl-[acyl-carrier protein] reductase